MKKIRKFEVIKMMDIFKEYNCKTIDDIINLLNKELKNDTDNVFAWRLGE